MMTLAEQTVTNGPLSLSLSGHWTTMTGCVSSLCPLLSSTVFGEFSYIFLYSIVSF